MNYAIELFIVIGIPLILVAAYQLWAARLKDGTLYAIGLINTIHFMLFPAWVAAGLIWANKELIRSLMLPILIYVFTIVPMVSVAAAYYLLLHRQPNDLYAIISSFANMILGLAFWLAFFAMAIFY